MAYLQSSPKENPNTEEKNPLRNPFIAGGSLGFFQEIAGIMEREMLLLWVNFFSAESKQ